MSKDEAIATILLKLEKIEVSINNLIRHYVEKLIVDILDYCHREDFPESLIYTVIELVLKRNKDNESAELSSDTATLPVSELKMDDTTFKFYTGNLAKSISPDNIGILADQDFDTIKPKLRLYRRMITR